MAGRGGRSPPGRRRASCRASTRPPRPRARSSRRRPWNSGSPRTLRPRPARSPAYRAETCRAATARSRSKSCAAAGESDRPKTSAVREFAHRVTLADARCDKSRAAARYRRWCRSASSTGWRGRAAPGWCGDRRRARAGAWRRNGGARAAWRSPRARARRAAAPIASWMMRGESGPPRAPRKSGSSGSSVNGTRRDIGLDRAPHRGQHRHDALAPAFADHADRLAFAGRRVGAGQPKRLGDAQARSRRAASAPRRRARRSRAPRPAPRPYRSARALSAIESAFGRLLGCFGGRTLVKAVVEAMPCFSQKRAKERSAAICRPSVRGAGAVRAARAMKARTSAGRERGDVARAPGGSPRWPVRKRKNCSRSR